MSYNRLDKKLGAELMQAFSGMPSGVTSLNFKGNYLDSQLADVLTKLPAGLTALDLSWNHVCNKTGAELTLTFAAIPVSVTSINLECNYLFIRSGAELVEAFAKLPAGVTALDLSWNDLFRKNNIELVVAFAGIPRSVTSLDLSYNSLGEKTGAELAEALEKLPAGLTYLNLSGNYLYTKTGDELAQAFASIPSGMSSLSLNNDSLCLKTGTELAVAFSAIPSGVTSLDLRDNALGRMGAQKLRDFIQAIPSHVASIDLRKNELFTNKTPAEIDDFLLELGDVRGRLDLSHNGESEFSRAVTPLVQMDTSGIFGATLTLPPDITGNIASYLSGLPETSMFRVIKERAEMIGQNRAYIDYINNPSPFPPGVIIQPPRAVASPASEISNEEEHTGNVASLIERDIENERGALYEVPVDSNIENELDSQAVSWMQFICDIPSMPAIQLAAIALGVIVLLSCSSVGMLALGTGVTLFGGVGLAMNSYHTYYVEPQDRGLGGCIS